MNTFLIKKKTYKGYQNASFYYHHPCYTFFSWWCYDTCLLCELNFPKSYALNWFIIYAYKYLFSTSAIQMRNGSLIAPLKLTSVPFFNCFQLQQRVHQILNLRGGSAKNVRHIMRGKKENTNLFLTLVPVQDKRPLQN